MKPLIPLSLLFVRVKLPWRMLLPSHSVPSAGLLGWKPLWWLTLLAPSRLHHLQHHFQQHAQHQTLWTLGSKPHGQWVGVMPAGSNHRADSNSSLAGDADQTRSRNQNLEHDPLMLLESLPRSQHLHQPMLVWLCVGQHVVLAEVVAFSLADLLSGRGASTTEELSSQFHPPADLALRCPLG